MTRNKKIPNRLRKYRRIMGYSQKQVATLLHLKGTSRISEWESGVRFPSTRNLIKLSLLYHTLVESLYFDIREAFRQDLEGRDADHKW